MYFARLARSFAATARRPTTTRPAFRPSRRTISFVFLPLTLIMTAVQDGLLPSPPIRLHPTRRKQRQSAVWSRVQRSSRRAMFKPQRNFINAAPASRGMQARFSTLVSRTTILVRASPSYPFFPLADISPEEYDDAIAAWKESVTLQPSSPDAHISMSTLAYMG